MPGPLEWDLAALSDEVIELFPDVSPGLIALLRRMRSLCVAAKCRIDPRRAPEVFEEASLSSEGLRKDETLFYTAHMPRRIPRWVGLVVWPVLLGAFHIVLPLELSRLGRRRGWGNRRAGPGTANLVGVVPLVAGAALVGWALSEHYRAAPDRRWAIKPGLEPEYLLTGGPYRRTRNPMHLGGIGIWAGWAAWFGSAPVAVGLVVLTAIYRAGILWEERLLERRWGDEWRAYARRTPRWISPWFPRLLTPVG